jgi:hypothetical protein
VTTKFLTRLNYQRNFKNTLTFWGGVAKIEYLFTLSDLPFFKKHAWSEKLRVKPLAKYITKVTSSEKPVWEGGRMTELTPLGKKYQLKGNGKWLTERIGRGELAQEVPLTILEDESKQIFALITTYSFSDNLILSLGMQHRRDVYNLDINPEDQKDFTGNLWSIQLINKCDYKGYKVAVTLGLQREWRDYFTHTPGKPGHEAKQYKDKTIDSIFVKFYLGQ